MRLLKFEADWCGPCKMLTATMEDITFPFPIERVDVDKNSAAAIEYGVRGVPCLILLDEHNNVIKRVSGALTKQQLTEVFELE